MTLLVRGSSLEASMSQYLITQVGKLPNVEVRTNTEVVELESDQHLRALIVASGRESVLSRLPVNALFVCIGGVPRTEGAAQLGLALDRAGYVRTGAEFSSPAGAFAGWGCLVNRFRSNEPARAVRRWRYPQRVDQALRSRDRRGFDGSCSGPSAPR